MPKGHNFGLRNTEQADDTFLPFPEKVIPWLIIETLFLKRGRVLCFRRPESL
jgi:hypothetical protein